MRKGKIFVQIAAYRDPELPFTIADLVARAAFPRDLRIAVCDQNEPGNWLPRVIGNRRIQQVRVPFAESAGVCWARSRAQEFYDGEEFTLQLDSHHRFAPAWDRTLRDMCDSVASPKPLFTAYLPPYHGAGADATVQEAAPGKQVFTHFDHDGVVHFVSHPFEANELFAPARARFLSAHFIFTRGAFIEEVPYDPEVYFSGEEITMAARAYTHGYDLFHPVVPIAYHAYGREGHRRHWDDHNAEAATKTAFQWQQCQEKSVARIHAVLGKGDGVPARYGLGTARTRRDYELYAGLDFASRTVHTNTVEGLEPPSTRRWNWEADAAACAESAGEVQLDTAALTPDRKSDFWYFGMHDEREIELLRIDLSDREYLLGKRRTLPVQLWSSRKPASYTIIPHRKSGKWGQRLVRKLTPENYRALAS